jgi:hypothetical protein
MKNSKMPREFEGTCRPEGLKCGICEKRYGFQPHERKQSVEEAREKARQMGWTYRTDVGWCCSCRFQCPGLDPKQEPKYKEARRRNRRYPKPTARVRKIILRRNRNDGE